MVATGFLNKTNAPTAEAATALPTDLESPSDEQIEKNIVIFHDESTFQVNDDESWMWGIRGPTCSETKVPWLWYYGI